jgi:hypothetical protein
MHLLGILKGTIMKKSAVLSVLILGLLGALATAPAFAVGTVLFDNTTGNSYQGYAYSVSSTASPGGEVSDSFLLTSNATATSILLGISEQQMDPLQEVDWAITTSPSNEITTGTGNTYSSSIASGSAYIFTTVPEGNYGEYSATFSIPGGVQLQAGTEYWLEIYNIMGNDGSDDGYTYTDDWDVSGNSQSTAYYAYNSYIYNNYPEYSSGPTVDSNTFQILGEQENVTPEPSSFLLLGSGLAGLAGLIKRKLRA